MDTKTIKPCVFLGRLLPIDGSEKEPVPLKIASFISADVQSDVLSPSRIHVTALSIDQQLRQ